MRSSIVPIIQFTLVGRHCVPYPLGFVSSQVRLEAGGQGPTYGEALRSGWKQWRRHPGIVILEHDIAVPDETWTELAQASKREPVAVHAVPYRLYPASTGMSEVKWSNRVHGENGAWLFQSVLEAPSPSPAAFGLGCTYLPAALVDAMPDDLRQWHYPRLDSQLSQLAREHGIPVHATKATAVHLHY